MLSILLFLWGHHGSKGKHAQFHEFTPDDANRLATQIRANLALPHRLLVISDYPQDRFASDLDYLPLGEHFGDARALGGCWLRLKCFAPGMEAVLGERIAWIDLDSVVTGPLDPLLSRTEPLVLYKADSIVGQRWNGSFVLGNVRDNGDIWTTFDPVKSPDLLRGLREGRAGGPRGTDQAWLHHMRDVSTAHVTAQDGVYHWALRRLRSLPENARLVTFPGSMKMSDPRVQRISPWLGQFYQIPGFVYANGIPVVKPWPVVPDVSGGKFKSIMKLRREARAQARLAQARAG